jgi:transposase InsO family protein
VATSIFLSLLTTTLGTLGFFFLESKDEVFEHFRSLALRLNNEHPNCLKAIRSDNGTEFRNASFDQFYLEHGVDQQFSAPCVPQ